MKVFEIQDGSILEVEEDERRKWEVIEENEFSLYKKEIRQMILSGTFFISLNYSFSL